MPKHPAAHSPTKKIVAGQFTDHYRMQYPGAFAANDMYAVVMFPDGYARTLGTLASLSISTHRDAFPVTAMPYVGPKGFTQGHRTIAGSMVFHSIDRNVFNYGLNPDRGRETVDAKHLLRGRPMADTLPLFDLHITYVNEEGMASFEALYGIRILDFGKSMSLDNLLPAESYSYMATDYEPMRPVVGNTKNEEGKFSLHRTRDRDQKPLRRADATSPGALYDPNLNPPNETA